MNWICFVGCILEGGLVIGYIAHQGTEAECDAMQARLGKQKMHIMPFDVTLLPPVKSKQIWVLKLGGKPTVPELCVSFEGNNPITS